MSNHMKVLIMSGAMDRGSASGVGTYLPTYLWTSQAPYPPVILFDFPQSYAFHRQTRRMKSSVAS